MCKLSTRHQTRFRNRDGNEFITDNDHETRIMMALGGFRRRLRQAPGGPGVQGSRRWWCWWWWWRWWWWERWGWWWWFIDNDDDDDDNEDVLHPCKLEHFNSSRRVVHKLLALVVVAWLLLVPLSPSSTKTNTNSPTRMSLSVSLCLCWMEGATERDELPSRR